MTITAPVTDSNGEPFEEDETLDLRARLGFRSPRATAPTPTTITAPRGAGSPLNPEGYHHEIDPHHPMTAHHTLAVNPSIVASLYPGEHARPEYDAVHTATLEAHLDQDGRQDPVIAVNLRHYPQRKPAGVRRAPTAYSFGRPRAHHGTYLRLRRRRGTHRAPDPHGRRGQERRRRLDGAKPSAQQNRPDSPSAGAVLPPHCKPDSQIPERNGTAPELWGVGPETVPCNIVALCDGLGQNGGADSGLVFSRLPRCFRGARHRGVRLARACSKGRAAEVRPALSDGLTTTAHSRTEPPRG